jgi:PPOX class probable F420-dependent enzyme
VIEDEARRRLTAARVGRLATVRPDGRPHVVPCCFAVDEQGDRLYTAVDDVKAKSTTALRRLDNIAAHPHVSLLADHYDDEDWSALWWVRVDGTARIEADSPTGSALLAQKYDQYRRQPPPGPCIVVDLERWTAWP